MRRPALFAGLVAFVGASLPAAERQEPGWEKPLDRSSYYVPGTETSNDLRRVPVPPGQAAPPGTLIIRNARLFDGSGTPARGATILIERDRIKRIDPAGTAEDWPADAKVIDAAGKTVMPGLIDLHTHLTYVTQFGQPPELTSESQADAALRGVERLRYFLESGITSVRDLSSHGMAPFILKRWVNEGRIAGPRIFAAGQLIVGQGGHGADGYAWRTAPAYPDASVREADGADDWRAAVRENFKRGADLIKVSSHFDESEIAAAVVEAHRLGLKVVADTETIFTEMAVKAGVDSIEHPLPRSDEAIRLMAAKGIAAVPTFIPYQIINSRGGYYGSPSRRFSITEETMFDMGRKLRRAGVKLGVGTDLIVDWYQRLPSAYIHELHNFERLGYSPAAALVAATRTNAEILGMADKLGTIEPGKLADLIIIDGRPDRDVDDLEKVDTVIVGGRLLLSEGRVRIEPHQGRPAVEVK